MGSHYRKRDVRAGTINISRLSLGSLESHRAAEPDDGARRLPLVRGECLKDFDRPCPYVSCRHHLFLDVDPHTGSLKLNFPDLFDEDGTPRLDEMPATCSLDIADDGGVVLERVGELLNLTRERSRQLEGLVLERMRVRLGQVGVTDGKGSNQTLALFENPYIDGR